MISAEGSAPFSHPHWQQCVVFWPNFLPFSGHRISAFSQAPLTFLLPHLGLGRPNLRTNFNFEVTDECQRC